jgi:hypothetical protein
MKKAYKRNRINIREKIQFWIAIVLTFSFPLFSFSQDLTYEQKIEKMIEVSGSKKNFEVVILNMVDL